MPVHFIDTFLIIFYMGAILIFGLFFRKYVSTTEDYFLAGKMLPWWVISFSIIGTNIGAYDYIGAAGGIGVFFEKLASSHPQHLKLFLPLDNPYYPWLGMIFGLGLVLSPAWWCANQSIIQRTLGGRSEWDAKAGMLFAV